MSVKPAPRRFMIGILSLIAVVTVLGVLTAPALMAQDEAAGAPAAADEGTPAAEAPMEPAEPTAEQTTTPPTPPGAGGAPTTPPEAGGTTPPTPETIEVVTETVEKGRTEDEQKRLFYEDMSRRTSPLDKQEMYENEHDWYRIAQQYDYNAIPDHKEIGVSNGSDWWTEYCGN